MNIPNFVVLDSIHGRFIVNRHCDFQAETLIKTGATHIEQELTNIFIMIDSLPPNAVIIDAGANAGFFTVPVANRVRGRGHRIISFEPQRTMYRALSGTLVLNDIDFCELINAGLGDQPGVAIVPDLDYSIDRDYGSVGLCYEGQGYDVEVKTIDGLELNRLDFLKIDVEGWECPVIAGGIKTIKQHRPYIWIEYFNTGIPEIKDALKSVPDYTFLKIDYQNMLCMPQEKVSQFKFDGVENV